MQPFYRMKASEVQDLSAAILSMLEWHNYQEVQSHTQFQALHLPLMQSKSLILIRIAYRAAKAKIYMNKFILKCIIPVFRVHMKAQKGHGCDIRVYCF